ncbi:MAG: hypothetical protein ACRDUY_06735, partial [Nitriliruptorales bacterium]
TWAAWFAISHALWGIGWEVEMWTGSIVFSVLTGAGLTLLAPGRARGEEDRDAPVPPAPRAAAVPPDGQAEADISLR